MTAFTSFVAVEDRVVNEGGRSRTIQVPVELPEGTRHEGFGIESRTVNTLNSPMATAPFIGGRRGDMAAERGVVRQLPLSLPPAKEANKAAKKMTDDLGSIAANGGTGKVEIRLFLSDASEQSMVELRKLGFEIISRPGQAKLFVGRIAADKLAQLAALSFVQHVAAR